MSVCDSANSCHSLGCYHTRMSYCKSYTVTYWQFNIRCQAISKTFGSSRPGFDPWPPSHRANVLPLSTDTDSCRCPVSTYRYVLSPWLCFFKKKVRVASPNVTVSGSPFHVPQSLKNQIKNFYNHISNHFFAISKI